MYVCTQLENTGKRAVAKPNLNSESCQVLLFAFQILSLMGFQDFQSYIVNHLFSESSMHFLLNAHFQRENTLKLSLCFQLNSTAALLKDINLNGQKVRTHILKAYFHKKEISILFSKAPLLFLNNWNILLA